MILVRLHAMRVLFSHVEQELRCRLRSFRHLLIQLLVLNICYSYYIRQTGGVRGSVMPDVSIFGLDFPVLSEFVAAVVGVPTFAATCYALGKRAGNAGDKKRIENLEIEVDQFKGKNRFFEDRFNTLEKIVGDAQDFWLSSPDATLLATHQKSLLTSVPIITVMNLKGGVGKTTICANLAAYFAEQGKRVLLIDCDYQGSLSDTVLSHARVEKFIANSHLLIQRDEDPARLRAAAERLSSIDSRLWIYPAFYGYSRAEIRMMFRWLVGRDKEIRFNLSDYLQSVPFKEDEGTRFDIVLIDAPPRLLTGVVNALTASTHVLVPTILDGQSLNATLNTLAAIQQFRMKLNPQLQVLGVVPSMVAAATGYNGLEETFIESLERQIPLMYNGIVPVLTGTPICRRQELAKAGGSEILFAADGNAAPVRAARDMFRELGQSISGRLKWNSSGNHAEVYVMPGQDKRAIFS